MRVRRRTWVGATLVAMSLVAGRPVAQTPAQPTNSHPNPYQTVENFLKLPEGRTWGATSAVEIDRDGRSIWVAERCTANTCLDRATGQMSALPSILKFDPTGKLVTSFGAGMLIFPHGIHVDRDGNVWVTDGQDNAPQPAPQPAAQPAAPPAAGRGAAPNPAATRFGPLPGATTGHQVYKFSAEGKLLMTLGKPGGAADPDYFYQPNDVLVAPNGDIFVSEGHGGANARVLKFNRDGKFLKAFGKKGAGPGEIEQPHALAMDSRGRLFVGDRSNNRIQIFDQEGMFLAEWSQFSRPSGLYHRQKRRALRGGFGVGVGLTQPRRLEAGNPHRQRPRRRRPVLHSGSGGEDDGHERRRGRGGRQRRHHLRRRGRASSGQAVRAALDPRVARS